MIEHFSTCRADYPEKPKGEKARDVVVFASGDHEKVRQCVDCGAYEIVREEEEMKITGTISTYFVPDKGVHITKAARDAVQIARRRKELVTLVFNDEKVGVTHETTADDVITALFNRAREK